MNNIFADYLSIYDYNVYDVLMTYANLFDELDINIDQYEDNFCSYDWESSILQDTLKKILLYKAQEEEIISYDIDIDECFEVHNQFSIKASECEDCQQIVESFEDWCGIKLDII